MIRRITSILNESVTAIPVGERVPFAEVIDGVPTVHAGNGQFVPVINDNAGGVSYWRANGAQQVQQMDKLAACGDAVRISVPVALVAFVRREQCDAPDALLNSAAHQINASLRSIRDSIQGAFAVNASSMTLGIDLARTNEIKDFVVPSSLAVLTLAAVIHIDASPVCLEKCGEPYDIVCTLIDRASNAKVVECLGPERVAEICDAPPPVCDPLGFDLHNSEDTILVSGMLPNPCGKTLELDAPDATVQLKDSGGAPIGSPVDFPSGTTRDMTAPNGTVKTTDGATTVMAVKSNGEGNLPRTHVVFKDASDAEQATTEYYTAFDGDELYPDTVIPRREIKYVGGTGTGLYATLDRLVLDTLPAVPIPLNLKFGWAAGNGDTLTWTVTADEAGTYGTYTPTGTNGTITYSKNGGAYAALSGSITLAVSDTIAVRRTTTTNAGSVKWEA